MQLRPRKLPAAKPQDPRKERYRRNTDDNAAAESSDADAALSDIGMDEEAWLAHAEASDDGVYDDDDDDDDVDDKGKSKGLGRS